MELSNDKGAIALYHQLINIFSAKIDNKEWLPGERIPTEHELCDHYKVSRITVRQALAELEKEGRLIRKQGKGTFVAFTRIEQNLVSFYSFSEEFKKMGLKPRNKVLEFIRMTTTKDIAKKLRLKEPESDVYFIKRLRYAGDILMAIEDTWLPADLFPSLIQQNLNDESLYNIMRNHYNIIPNSAKESFGAIAVDKKQAELFGINKGAPALDIERIAFSGKVPVEYTSGAVRGDKFRFYIRLDG